MLFGTTIRCEIRECMAPVKMWMESLIANYVSVVIYTAVNQLSVASL